MIVTWMDIRQVEKERKKRRKQTIIHNVIISYYLLEQANHINTSVPQKDALRQKQKEKGCTFLKQGQFPIYQKHRTKRLKGKRKEKKRKKKQ